MFDADRPILKSEQDRLNRTLFAKYLARCILDHHETESLVIGLNGGWGVGKTSVINLTIEELNQAAANMADAEKPIILNFSSWSYSTQNQIIYNFFRRLSSALRNSPNLKNADKIISLLELYVSFFTHNPVPKALRNKKSWWKRLFGAKEENYAWESGRDLTVVKAELNALLRQQNLKIIIVIDNIARMLDVEIKQIFQIIKSIGDYENTVYLIAIDKEQIVPALNRIDGQGGENFIEKIVQLPFEVPPIAQQDLENILFARLKDILVNVPEGAWDRERWADVYYSSLKFFFQNVRDITRYVNTLSFKYPRVKDLVDPVDYFALTAIEVFLPEVYSGIRENKDLFADLAESVYILDAKKLETDKARIDEILSRTVLNISQEKLFYLLESLFPRLNRLYEPNKIFFYTEAAARKSRRISSLDLFDIYFRLSMAAGNIPKSEFDTILSMITDEGTFSQALTRLNQDNRITKFLDLLDSTAINQIPVNHIGQVINALLDNGDLFPEGEDSQLSLNTAMRIHRIIHRLLKRLESADDRFSILQAAISKANKSLYVIVHELMVQALEHQENTDTFIPVEFRDLSSAHLQSLQQFAATRIAYWASIGRLEEHPKLLPLLQAWKAWGNEHDYQKNVEKIVQSDRGILAFLLAVLEEPINKAMCKYEKTDEWSKYVEQIESLVPVKTLEPHAKALFEDLYFEKLREREQLALMIFLDLIKADTTKVIPKTTV